MSGQSFGFLRAPSRGPAGIRRIGPEFAQACAGIHARSFAHSWSAPEFETLLAGRDVVAEAATASGGWKKFWRKSPALAGFVLSRTVAGEAEILTIAVAPSFRRQGIGGALLGAHIATLAAQGIKVLFLEVEAGNHAALALYRSFDFYQVGTRKGYYPKAGAIAAAALVLRRDFA
ncbi:MAG: GNAT family N-acetyltransferase [Beijerinckiaceae bacterium]|nr:MAG: GNAT family N-acetyltransferase [Beijerinckiaceae bacterium]